MNEGTLRKYARDGLHKRGVLTTHHEDMLNVGLPDLSYSHGGIHGWIELKWAPHWPHRPATLLKLPHYTTEQKHFLLTRGRAGGRCWLLLRVGEREHLLFDHEQAQEIGALTRAEMEARARMHSQKYIEFDILIKRLTE